MPVAAKMLFSWRCLEHVSALADRLKITRDDIRMMRLYNMFAVV